MQDLKGYIRESRDQEVDNNLENIINNLKAEGLSVEFGNIGVRTTYALIHDENHDVEIVGYTFLKDMKFYKKNVGKLRALQQAMARKTMANEVK